MTVEEERMWANAPTGARELYEKLKQTALDRQRKAQTSLEGDIKRDEVRGSSPQYPGMKPSGSIDYTTLPSEAARRDMNSWIRRREDPSDVGLRSRDR